LHDLDDHDLLATPRAAVVAPGVIRRGRRCGVIRWFVFPIIVFSGHDLPLFLGLERFRLS
jgi:hypothetical protein